MAADPDTGDAPDHPSTPPAAGRQPGQAANPVSKPATSAGRALLLDTHALLWWLLDSPELSATARAAIAAPGQRVLVSAASAWELGTKYRIGKLPEAQDIVVNFSQYLRKQRFEALPISVDHALAAGQLPGPHRDPFDRMLMAQARIEGVWLVTLDPVFRSYGVAVLW